MWLKTQLKKLFTKKLNTKISEPNTKTKKHKKLNKKNNKIKTLRKNTSPPNMIDDVSRKLNPSSMLEDLPNDLKNNMLNFLNNTEISSVLKTNKILNNDFKNTQNFSKYENDKIQAYEIKKYKGLWRQMKRNINNMTRKQIIDDLKKFRDSWEEYPGINQDLSDENINDMVTDDLLDRLHSYYSDDNKKNVEDILDI